MQAAAATAADISTWEKAGVVATIVAAAATVAAVAVAAFSAWQSKKAAEASLEISRDSQEALALAMRPDIRVEPWFGEGTWTSEEDRPLYGRAVVFGGFSATDVVVELKRQDGNLVRSDLVPLMPPTRELNGISPGSSVTTPQAGVVPSHTQWEEIVEHVFVEYGDERRLARWRLEAVWHQLPDFGWIRQGDVQPIRIK